MEKKRSLLELLTEIRTYKAIDRAVMRDKHYCATLKEQEKAYKELDKAGLNKEQKRIVDSILCSLNANGAAYGRVAYRLGLRDGIRFVSEMNKI